MKIIRAKHYGFCFGVKRAYSLVEQSLKNKGKVQVWGELIHNKPALDKLKKKGMEIIKTFNKISGEIIIRSHGISEKKLKKIKEKTNIVKNATCPYVIAVHNYAKQFEKQGRRVIIIGDANHPEMIGVKEDLNNPICILSAQEAKNIKKIGKVGVVVQTTLKKETFDEILNILKEKAEDLEVKNTICNATTERQQAISELSKKCDIVIVVGGKKSSNSKKLEELSKKYCITKKIEFVNELKINWFKGKNIIGISAGASTPDWLINEVEEKIKDFYNSPI